MKDNISGHISAFAFGIIYTVSLLSIRVSNEDSGFCSLIKLMFNVFIVSKNQATKDTKMRIVGWLIEQNFMR